MARRYPIPAGRARVEEVIRRSRFITTADYAPTVEAARRFIQEIRAEFADASHNCWAYLVGPPGSTAHVGMSDDGEPSGTAGRPMLAVLQGSGIGDIVVVVTRYFGGTKLGTGGLVRAYAGGVKAILEALPLTEKVERTTVQVRIPYALFEPVQHILPDYEAEITNQRFAEAVTLEVRLPTENIERFTAHVREMSRGQAAFSFRDTP
ncbi:MAG TPA: YigZ family protein [Caldilineae bacterium]|nr:YigZ family protein [Caldilineae bacterium]